jgi:RimJ/RimL family protein N-acetyltransferase
MVDGSGADPTRFARFVVEYLNESGREGSPHFALGCFATCDEISRDLTTRLARRLDEASWGRAWALVEPGSGRFVGHVELLGGRCRPEHHRAALGMGVFRAYGGQGHGRRLLGRAVDWAREQRSIDWIDLSVFATNQPARKLYTRFGFMDTGLRRDAYRLDDGPCVDEVQMSLRLG